MADFDHYDDPKPYRQTGFIDHSEHQRERAAQIMRTRGGNLGLGEEPPPPTPDDYGARPRAIDYPQNPLLRLVAYTRPPMGKTDAWEISVDVDPAAIDQAFDKLKAKVKDVLGLPPDTGISAAGNEDRPD